MRFVFWFKCLNLRSRLTKIRAMKLYRLKDEVLEHLKPILTDKQFTEIEALIIPSQSWTDRGYSLTVLEEVEQRVELDFIHSGSHLTKTYRENSHLTKRSDKQFTEEERLLCEQALNGELFTRYDLYTFQAFIDNCGLIQGCFEVEFNKWLKQRKA